MVEVNLSPAVNFEGTSGIDINLLSWTVSLSEPSAEEVTVSYRLLAGTGGVAMFSQNNGDTDVYSNSLEGSVTFARARPRRR